MEWFTFKAAGHYVGIDAQHIHRVMDEVEITPVPFVPSCHLGVIYYRGELFDVIHAGNLFEKQEARHGRDSRVILLKWSGKKLALVPDQIIGLILIEDTEEQAGTYAHEDYTVRLIAPDQIWKQIEEFFYGHHKVQEDLHSGI